MGLFDDDDFELDELLESVKKYPSCVVDLNESEVQAIFERCLAKEDSKNESRAELFYRSLGYNEEDSIPITFDSDIISQNRKSIMYLYGQLDSVHTGKYLNERQLVTDFAVAYTGKTWTKNKWILLQLLYLGCNDTVVVILPFEKMKSNSTLIHPSVKPTLSPKDPAFPEWWEQHKAEWEA